MNCNCFRSERNNKPPIFSCTRLIIRAIYIVLLWYFFCVYVRVDVYGYAFVFAAYWRFWLCVSVVYELFLIFILFQVCYQPQQHKLTYYFDIVSYINFSFSFQTVHDGRQFMKYIDPKLGVPLPERDYGGNCLIYDPGNPADPFHNIWVCITTNIKKTQYRHR